MSLQRSFQLGRLRALIRPRAEHPPDPERGDGAVLREAIAHALLIRGDIRDYPDVGADGPADHGRLRNGPVVSVSAAQEDPDQVAKRRVFGHPDPIDPVGSIVAHAQGAAVEKDRHALFGLLHSALSDRELVQAREPGLTPDPLLLIMSMWIVCPESKNESLVRD